MKKLNLEQIKVKSFVTDLTNKEKETVNGAAMSLFTITILAWKVKKAIDDVYDSAHTIPPCCPVNPSMWQTCTCNQK